MLDYRPPNDFNHGGCGFVRGLGNATSILGGEDGGGGSSCPRRKPGLSAREVMASGTNRLQRGDLTGACRVVPDYSLA